MTNLRKVAQQATPRVDLLAELMDSNEPKTEREHAAVYEIERLRAAMAQAGAEPVAWQGGEGWESLAWELCADENGEESCDELVWEGGPIPEPWGDRWMKYEGEAKRLIAIVHKHTAPLYTHPPARVPLTDEQIIEVAKNPMTTPCSPWWLKDDVVLGDVRNAALVFARAIERAHGIGGGK